MGSNHELNLPDSLISVFQHQMAVGKFVDRQVNSYYSSLDVANCGCLSYVLREPFESPCPSLLLCGDIHGAVVGYKLLDWECSNEDKDAHVFW